MPQAATCAMLLTMMHCTVEYLSLVNLCEVPGLLQFLLD